jgi:hypothetical protein
MSKVEQRTTRDGALAGRRTIRTDAFRRILEGIQRLEASLDRAAEQIESEKPTAERKPRTTLRERILGAGE